MSRILISGTAVVATIAAIKTLILLTFVFPKASVGVVTITGLYVLFFALTAAVAYVSFIQLRAFLERQRKEKLVPGAGEPIAKETVVLRYATDWRLSQAEADIAIFVAKGFSNNEIAEMRGCAVSTVKSQLGKICQKSGLESRYQLISFVTDEVCAMASESADDTAQIETRKVLPLTGRVTEAA